MGAGLFPWVLGCSHGFQAVPMGSRLSPWVLGCCHGFWAVPTASSSPDVAEDLAGTLVLLLGNAQHVQHSQAQALLLLGQAQRHGHAAPDKVTAGLGRARSWRGFPVPAPCTLHLMYPRHITSCSRLWFPAAARELALSWGMHPPGDTVTPITATWGTPDPVWDAPAEPSRRTHLPQAL